MQATPTCLSFAGIDWSWQHHALCILNDDGERLEEATVTHTKPGLAKITTLLRRHRVTRVGIERADGPVVEHLLRDGFEVVVISARQDDARRWRTSASSCLQPTARQRSRPATRRGRDRREAAGGDRGSR